jgi:hypothetical protein
MAEDGGEWIPVWRKGAKPLGNKPRRPFHSPPALIASLTLDDAPVKLAEPAQLAKDARPPSPPAASPPPAARDTQRLPRQFGQNLQVRGRVGRIGSQAERPATEQRPAPLDRLRGAPLPRPLRRAFTEGQMTGLDLKSDVLIEVAAIVTDRNLKQLDKGIEFVIRTPKEKLDGMVRRCPLC